MNNFLHSVLSHLSETLVQMDESYLSLLISLLGSYRIIIQPYRNARPYHHNAPDNVTLFQKQNHSSDSAKISKFKQCFILFTCKWRLAMAPTCKLTQHRQEIKCMSDTAIFYLLPFKITNLIIN